MAQNDPTMSLPIGDITKYLRKAKQAERWHRRYRGLQKPEQLLQQRKRTLNSDLQGAREDARSYARKGDYAGHDSALDRIISCARELGAFEPDCNCKADEMRRIYADQVNQCFRNLQGLFMQDAISRSPSPSAESRTSETGETPEPSDRPTQSAENGSTSTAVLSQPNAQLTLALDEGHAHRDASHERPRPDSLDKRASEAASGPVEAASGPVEAASGLVEADTITVGGDGSERATSNKRKASDPSVGGGSALPTKRLRGDENQTTTTIPNYDDGDDDNDDDNDDDDDSDDVGPDYKTDSDVDASTTSDDPEAEVTRFASQHTIAFNDLYQDGKGQFKHYIVEYEDKFYILRCDQCRMHFGNNPILGAARHLDSRRHDNMYRGHALAIKLLGIEVLECNSARLGLNNRAFERSLLDGYVPEGNPQAASRRPHARNQATGGRPRSQQGSEDGVYPIPGETYLAYWPGSDCVGVVCLPGRRLGDASFEDIGLNGSSPAAITALLEKVPECYRTCPDTGRITGWEVGFEDGGEKVREREYPVFCPGRMEGCHQQGSAAWVPVGHMMEYHRGSLAGDENLIANLEHLRMFEEARGRDRAAKGQRREVASARTSRSKTTETHSSLYTTSPSTTQPAEGVGAPGKPTGAPANPPDTPTFLANGADRRRSEGRSSNLRYPGLPAGPTNPPPHGQHCTNAVFRPMQDGAAGSAMSPGKGTPLHGRSGSSVSNGGNPPARPSLDPTANRGGKDRPGSGDAAIMDGTRPPTKFAAPRAASPGPGDVASSSSSPFTRPTDGAASAGPHGGSPPGTSGRLSASQAPVSPDLPSPPSTAGTLNSPIKLEGQELPRTAAPHHQAKRTPNGFKPPKRSFGHHASAAQGSPSTASQSPTAQSSKRKPMQQE